MCIVIAHACKWFFLRLQELTENFMSLVSLRTAVRLSVHIHSCELLSPTVGGGGGFCKSCTLLPLLTTRQAGISHQHSTMPAATAFLATLLLNCLDG